MYRSGQALNPDAVPALVYVNTAHGAVLSAAMYLVPRGQTPPQPGGCLTQWHIHTDLCFSTSGGTVVGTEANSSCGAGTVNKVTPADDARLDDACFGRSVGAGSTGAQRSGGRTQDASP